MKRKRYTEEQIISILKQHEAGRSMPDLSRENGVAQNTLYRWKSKYGGMEVSEAKRQRELEMENARLKRLLAEQYPRYGCPTLHDMLRTEGLVLNHKRTHRVYCEESLQVRTKKRKKLTRPRIPLLVPDHINERWSVDFVSDQLAKGRRFRVFNLVDDFSRECLLQVIDFSISGERLARELDRLAEQRSLPARIVLDNGPELTSKAMFFWSKRTGVKL